MPPNFDNIEQVVVWQPIPGTSQEIALDSRCRHTLYSGSRGPGKTDAQLMRFRRLVGLGYGAFCRGIIFDREYKALDDLVAKSKRWFPQFEDGAKWKASKDTYKWVWPTGEELLFRQIKSAAEYLKFHGHEYCFIGWNELTKYPTSECYDIMMSINRTSFRPEDHPKFVDRVIYETHGVEVPIAEGDPKALKIYLPELPLEVFSTTNPSGPGHSWVKKRFIDPAPYGVPYETVTRVFNPRTQQEEDVKTTQVTIFGSYMENIYLTPEYIAELLNDPDENRKKAWTTGSWDIVAGGALGDLWRPTIHILPRFAPPKDWRIDRSFDWGSTHPFSVGWWAVANGEEATIVHDGETYSFCPPPGTLIQIGEWYGAKELGDNKGLKLSAVDIADGIVAREKLEVKSGWYHSKPRGGPADNQIRDVRESDVDTIENKMKLRGVGWTRSDKSPGSRVNGLQLIRDRLAASIKGEGPGLYFMEHCRASIATLPTLPRDSKRIDDVDTDAEDHAYDMVRYRVLAGSKELPTNTEFTFSL